MNAFQFAETFRHEVTVAEKKACIEKLHPAFPEARLPPIAAETSLANIDARIRYRQAFPQDDDEKMWIGIHSLAGGVSMPPFEEDKIAEKCQAFNDERLHGVMTMLKYYIFVFLAGLTGVGKTTFIEKVLAIQPNVRVYRGDNEEEFLKWLLEEVPPGTLKIIFFDEANLSHKKWSEFEGLFDDPPWIWHKGKLYLLTPEHKAAFAGNPKSFGGARQVAPFFERHGGARLFKPLIPESIYEEILKPIFKNTPLESKTLIIAKEILRVYVFLCALSTTAVLISPRELEMIALLVLSHHVHAPLDDSAITTMKAIHAIARGLVPKDHLANFDKQFKLPVIVETAPTVRLSASIQYTPTPSRAAPAKVLQDILTLREWRQDEANTLNDLQRYGGLGGIVIDGAKAIGKMSLLLDVLLQNGYHEAHLTDHKPPPEKTFYRLPASLSDEDMEAQLLKIFHAGQVAILPKLTPRMERLLNSLLMMKTLDGKRPEKPGFTVIVLQPPQSQALARRMVSIPLPDYTGDELLLILKDVPLSHALAAICLNLYKEARAKAISDNLSPVPTLMDLLKAAKEMKANQEILLQEADEINGNKSAKSATGDFAKKEKFALFRPGTPDDKATKEFLKQTTEKPFKPQ